MNASSRTLCLPGTRREMLNEIAEWITVPSGSGNILWLSGVAGSGKSTMATTVEHSGRCPRSRLTHTCQAHRRSAEDPNVGVAPCAMRCGCAWQRTTRCVFSLSPSSRFVVSFPPAVSGAHTPLVSADRFRGWAGAFIRRAPPTHAARTSLALARFHPVSGRSRPSLSLPRSPLILPRHLHA
ncbi:hypothetical protein DFH09DRAFT_928797 [Mycena vulgaris]|nr:hypothetical protein DFH09DRAFT_928797 [Mycena vulgaris]